jgi:hypothetical protein
MELLNSDTVWGVFFFSLGIITLILCTALDQKIHYKMRGLRRLEWYGRREIDTKATLPFNVLCSCMTFAGSGFALYGFIRFFSAVL